MQQKYNIGDKVNNFEIVSLVNIDELDAVLYEFKHSSTKAKLIYVSTKDSNKLFSVAFKTVPENSTGVFHILEHSVLCGSKKYPVREPFVELIKSSMNTFLNAMTFPDKTLYPISSRNEKDFLNLTEVYLDAVFKPSIYTNPNIFYQEGWHYELDTKNDSASLNGVVFNEMKGAMSSVDERIQEKLSQLLFPATCYSYNSGGDPTCIPSLTYEEFINNHKRFYSADNAIFYLEGDMDINKPISLIEEYLEDALTLENEISIKLQTPCAATHESIEYAISEEENEDQKTHITFSKIIGNFDEKDKYFASVLISQYLTDTNESPLTKKILSEKLAQDVSFIVEKGIAQLTYTLQMSNTEKENEEKIIKAIDEVVSDICENGFDKKELEAILNRLEFSTHECGEPRALYHNIAVLESYLYGGKPDLFLTYGECFKKLRSLLDTDYLKDILVDLFDKKNLMTVVATPSKTLAKEEKEAEEKYVKDIKDTWSENDLKSIISLNESLEKWQQTPDSPEQLAKMPMLSLSDVEKEPVVRELNAYDYNNIKVLVHPEPISDVCYISLLFPVPKKYQNDLPYVSLLENVLLNIPTKNYSVFKLNQEVKRLFGSLSFVGVTNAKRNDNDSANLYFNVQMSLLKSNVEEAIDLLKEITLNSIFDNEELVKNTLLQLQENFRNDIISGGHKMGMRNAAAPFGVSLSILESTEGVTCYEALKDLCSNFDTKLPKFISFLSDFSKDLFTKDKLVIGLTVPVEDANETSIDTYKIDKILFVYPDGDDKDIVLDVKLEKNNTFVSIPAAISFASAATSLISLGEEYNGSWNVVSKILSFEYLWNEVRVQGGAYGVGFSTGLEQMAFYSYRDPNPSRSFGVYENSTKFLNSYINSDEDIEKYIISTIASTEPLLPPYSTGLLAFKQYLNNTTYEERLKTRNEMLNLKKEDLEKNANIIQKMWDNCSRCLIGNDDTGFESTKKIQL